MDSLREQSFEASEVAVGRMMLVGLDVVVAFERRQRPLAVELERPEPSGREHILKRKGMLAS